MSTDKISIIVPCYWSNVNLIELTDTCLKSMGEVGQVIVVDDGSPLQHKPKCDTFVVRSKNGGYAAAVNSGLHEATGDILIISNNDIEFVSPLWLEHLLYPLRQGYSISSIRTTDADGWLTEDFIEEDAKFGSLWAMKRIVYETIGGLDTSFGKGYFEDLDYHQRAKDAGFKIAKNHNGLVEHVGKATFSVVDPDDTSFWTARERFIEKHGNVW